MERFRDCFQFGQKFAEARGYPVVEAFEKCIEIDDIKKREKRRHPDRGTNYLSAAFGMVLKTFCW